MEQCAACRFWQRIEPQVGECRRRSPAALTTVAAEEKVIANKGIWPRTYEAEWCGDFEQAS